jgi:hypothetical protein
MVVHGDPRHVGQPAHPLQDPPGQVWVQPDPFPVLGRQLAGMLPNTVGASNATDVVHMSRPADRCDLVRIEAQVHGRLRSEIGDRS